ncbi:molybdopterin-binding/glycosyltransferase family 2 protein [Aminobacter anthyllidis]|uniref:molybdopterin-binding/glycosyltransferase family 2 protein n=1 Tax=Aminobacter anthyllidis TaxID=1035067 RepID=UPI002458D98A|nr:molybdopterin-binding/glycosyltransferase family 2 protein [Aminobacter anthyllidis]MDH4985249.1 molybdopterin-binding/glycosyltransferase family 2 protein [Aminobacter anthyllidis]
MKFGTIAVGQATGAVLAHSTSAGDHRYRKGHVLAAEDIAILEAAGLTEIVVAVLEPGDLGEDRAAEAIAASMQHRHVEVRQAATGRVNLHAQEAGVFTVDAGLIDALNAIDPSITVATLARYATVEKGQMVATVKIIPFAVGGHLVRQATELCAAGEIFAVNAFVPKRVGVIQTVLPSVKASVLDKTSRLTEHRLARSGSRLTAELRTPHEAGAVAEAARALARDHDIVVIFGASALSDFDDVIPAAIRAAGGIVVRSGMPVDPGNLLVLGHIGTTAVIGAPGCARSPKENGFDWVLDRLMSGLEVTAADIAGMGVGGLLMEIPTRPQPRDLSAIPPVPKVHAVLLAAGRSSRMGGPNKLMALFEAKPLVRRTAERVLASKAESTVVVSGHQASRIREALAGLGIPVVHNADFASGLASSLKVGVSALPEDAAGALIVLGDMPEVLPADLDRLIESFERAEGRAIVRATHDGKRGNPIILPRSLFAAVAHLEGDTGARHLIESEGVDVIDVEIGKGAGFDVDTPEALEGAGGVLQG